jgi:hypothetical protein
MLLSQHFCFHLSVSLHQFSLLTFMYLLLLAEGQRAEAESNALSKIADKWKGNNLNFSVTKHFRDSGPSPRQSMTVLWWTTLLWVGVCPGYIRFPLSLPFNHSTVGLLICKAAMSGRAEGRVCCHLFRCSSDADVMKAALTFDVNRES